MTPTPSTWAWQFLPWFMFSGAWPSPAAELHAYPDRHGENAQQEGRDGKETRRTGGGHQDILATQSLRQTGRIEDAKKKKKNGFTAELLCTVLCLASGWYSQPSPVLYFYTMFLVTVPQCALWCVLFNYNLSITSNGVLYCPYSVLQVTNSSDAEHRQVPPTPLISIPPPPPGTIITACDNLVSTCRGLRQSVARSYFIMWTYWQWSLWFLDPSIWQFPVLRLTINDTINLYFQYKYPSI